MGQIIFLSLFLFILQYLSLPFHSHLKLFDEIMAPTSNRDEKSNNDKKELLSKRKAALINKINRENKRNNMTPEQKQKQKSQHAANKKIKRFNNRNKMTPEEIQNHKSKHATNEQTRW